MSMSLTEKLNRMLTFLVGLRDPLVAGVLSLRGFTSATHSEGWDLFATAAGAKLDPTVDAKWSKTGAEARAVLAELDTWENTWFPVIEASLRRHYPEVNAAVFANINQTEGRTVAVSVGTLLDRLQVLANQPNGCQALELLESRGFTPAVRTTAENLLASLKSLGELKPPLGAQSSREEQEKALDAAWAWYLEWSTIARTVITRGDVLVRLGLRKPKRSKGAGEKVEAPKPA